MMRYRVAATRLNMRQGPGTVWPVVDVLEQGQVVEQVQAADWVPIEAAGQVGWVSRRYLTEVAEAQVDSVSRRDFSTMAGTKAAMRAACEEQGLGLPEQIAYVLATVEWETGGTFQPVREAYWKDEAWRQANLRYYPYYGRGYVQLTWGDNYQKYARIMGIDLVDNPDLALKPEVALFILVHGFKHGTFTGKKLGDYINTTECDFIQARRCINGLDRAREIAALAEKYSAEIRDA